MNYILLEEIKLLLNNEVALTFHALKPTASKSFELLITNTSALDEVRYHLASVRKPQEIKKWKTLEPIHNLVCSELGKELCILPELKLNQQ